MLLPDRRMLGMCTLVLMACALPLSAAPCESCHKQHPPEVVALSDNCHSCHGVDAGHGQPPIQLAQDDTLERRHQLNQGLSGKGPGMSVEIYYQQSRVGTEPNPMVLIPAGEFLMGSDDRLPDEGPQHKRTTPAYYIDRYEVTNGQYKRFIDAANHKSPAHFRNRTYPPGKVDHPVTFVSWNDARDYCQWAGKRLPTEPEWEKAARGSDGRTYPWGNEFTYERANTPQRWKWLNRFGDTTPVGAFASGASPYGVYDMSGNVWEWVDAWYQPHPGNKVPSDSYGEQYRILKGGSWWDCSFYNCGISAPVFNRSFFSPRLKNETFGFRCAKDDKK